MAGTWVLPLIDRDEPRFAEASREMIQRSDYVVPYFNNHLRLDKPPLTYWAQVASYHVFGETDFAARFPSAVAAALVAVSLLIRGSRVGGERVGWRAAIVFTICLQTFVHAKAAVADMWLVLFVSTAHWSGLELLRDGLMNPAQRSTSENFREREAKYPLSWWWFFFYISLALGFLAKGPDRMGASVDSWLYDFLRAEFAAGSSIQICSRHSAHAGDRRSLGSSGVDSNPRRIFYNWNRSSRH